MIKRRTVLRLLAASLVFAEAFICSCSRRTPETVAIVRMGYLPITSDASFFVAMEKGFFKAQGLQVEPIKFETSNQALEALIAGRIDATAIVALEAALALEANTPDQFRIIEMTAATAETKVHRIVVKEDSPVKTLADLKGKRVGTFPGSQMVVFLKLILGRYFDAEQEVEIIQLKPPLQPQALESGQVDALFCLEPTGTLLESKGLARAISVNPLYEFIQKPFPTAASVVSTRMASEKPKVVASLVAALSAAHQYLKAHPEDAALTFPKYAPVDANIVTKVALYENWGLSAIDRVAVQRLADLYAAKGVVAKRLSTSTLYFGQSK
jgi:NitT/TauT family transport system substrate-binding protein